MSRDQRRLPGAGGRPGHRGDHGCARSSTDPVWLDVVPGVPAWLPDGRLLAHRRPRRRPPAGGRTASRSPAGRPAGRGGRVGRRPTAVLLAGHRRADRGAPVARGPADGVERLTAPGGCHSGLAAGGDPGGRVAGWAHEPVPVVDGAPDGAGRRSSSRRTPSCRRCVTAPTAPTGSGERELRGRASCCRGTTCPATPLPVLMDPYGGPHHREVVDAAGALAGGAVDRRPGLRGGRWPTAAAPAGAGRTGTGRSATSSPRSTLRGPGRRAARRSPKQVPDLDLTRVAIRGWSLRRLPRRAGRAAPPGRLPRRRRRRAGHRLAALRHLLHRALPRAPATRQPEVYDRNSLLADAPAADAGRCCSSTGWPTTTWWSRTPCGCRRRCSPPGVRTTCCRCPGSPT